MPAKLWSGRLSADVLAALAWLEWSWCRRSPGGAAGRRLVPRLVRRLDGDHGCDREHADGDAEEQHHHLPDRARAAGALLGLAPLRRDRCGMAGHLRSPLFVVFTKNVGRTERGDVSGVAERRCGFPVMPLEASFSGSAVRVTRIGEPRAGSGDSLVRRALPVYLALLLALLTAVSILLLYALRHVLLILFVSVLFAAALSGPSEWLHDRLRLPRGIAAVLIYVVAFAVLVGVGWLVVPPLLGQVAEFADRAPQYADQLRGSPQGVRRAAQGLSRRCRRSTTRCRGSATRSSTGPASGRRLSRPTSSRCSSTC